MQQIVNPASVMTGGGGGKKYAHYITVYSNETVNPWYEWAFYIGPIITDTESKFTLSTLGRYLSGHFPPNSAISPSIIGFPGSGYYESYSVDGASYSADQLCIVTKSGGQMERMVVADDGSFSFYDTVVEI